MPSGVYVRKPNIKYGGFCKGHKFGKRFKKGFIPWNKGLKGIMKAWNKGKRGLYHHSEETIRKLKVAQKGKTAGEKHYRWNPDREVVRKNQRNDPEYKQWVKKVKKRDNNQCIFKGRNCFGYNIVHHILSWKEYPELRYEINNGITLCQYHHPRKRVDERRLIPIFTKLVKSKELICQ